MQANFLEQEPIIDNEYYYHYVKQLIPTITVEDINAKVKEWNNGKNMPFNQSVRFQFSQLLCQHLGRRIRNFSAKGGKTQRPGHQFPQNQRFVFAAD